MNQSAIDYARDEWLVANEAAVVEAQTYITKKGEFNPRLEKPWPKWEALRLVADETWYAYYNLMKGA